MSTPKKGDRVRVTYEGEYISPSRGGHAVRIRFDQWHDYHATAPADAKLEVLTPPVKVGDVIPARETKDLPAGSLVRGTLSDSHHLRTENDGWKTDRVGTDWSTPTTGYYTVVYLPEVAA